MSEESKVVEPKVEPKDVEGMGLVERAGLEGDFQVMNSEKNSKLDKVKKFAVNHKTGLTFIAGTVFGAVTTLYLQNKSGLNNDIVTDIQEEVESI